MLGTFENRQPRIKIEVKGNGGYSTIEAVVDSGFNGYLKLPYSMAFPLGLTLLAVGSGMVADGNMSAHLVCTGNVCIEGKCTDTTIDVHPVDVALIGTSLLLELKKTFTLDCLNKRVELVDSATPSPIGFQNIER